LRQTQGTVVPAQNTKGATSVVHAFLPPHFEKLDHAEIVGRVVHAVDLASPGIRPEIIKLNRRGD